MDKTVLVKSLRAVVLIPRDGTGRERPAQLDTIEDRGTGTPVPALKSLERYLGRPVTLHNLNQLMRTIVLGYRDAQRPVVDVYFPEQDITEGIIRIHVVEAVLGEVKVEGTEKADPLKLASQISLSPGDPIRSDSLERDLIWLNRNYFRTIGLIFEEGENEGESDIVLRVKESQDFFIFGSFANTGLALTGENQWNAGFLWGNAFGTDTMLSYDLRLDSDWDSLVSHSGYALIPLPWRHFIEISASRTEVDVQQDLGSSILLDVGGLTTQFGAGYIIPLPPIADGKWTHDIILGVDYLSTDNDIIFGGTTILGGTAAVLQFRGEYEMRFLDKTGSTSLNVSAIFSPGDMFGNNDDDSFTNLRIGSDSNYFYATANLERRQSLPLGLSAILELSGQWSNERLITNEQLFIGGYRSVRGFDESILRGDNGILASAELHFPTIPIQFGAIDISSYLQPYLFYDFGWVDNTSPLAAEVDQSLSSTGIGLNYQFGENLTARLEYGWGIDSPSHVEHDQKLHFSIDIKF
jgi:hemolysin activation/secretion protein